VIHFFLTDGLAAKEIPGHLSQVYAADAIKKTQVFHWVWEIRAGREDLSDEARPGRPCQGNLDAVLAHELENINQTIIFNNKDLVPGFN
jgi:hypothetical protein